MPSFEISLEIRPAEVDDNSIGDLTVRGRVRNTGDRPIRPEVHRSILSLNGEPSLEWMLAIGNGPLEDENRILQPGQAVEFARVMGPSLASKPGLYRCVLSIQGVESQPVTLIYHPLMPATTE